LKSAVKKVGFIAVATMLSKIMGMLRDIVLASQYGTGAELDAYMSASRIPVLFFDFTLGAAIVSTFIPVFNKYLQKGERERANYFANNFITIVVAISTAFAILGMLFSKQIVGIIAPGYAEDVKQLTSNLAMIMMPSVVFTALAYSFVGILQSLDEFNIPAIISLVSNSAVILYLVFLNKYFGVYGLAVAMLISWGLQAVVQIPSLIKKKYAYRPVLNLKDEGIGEVVRLAIPILISSWLQPICTTVNNVFASGMVSGSVSALDLANRLYIIIVGVFVYAITNYAFPKLAIVSEDNDSKKFANIATTSLYIMFVIIIPITVGMLLLSGEVITAVYARGEFDSNSVFLTSSALFFYVIGMPAYGVNEILNKCFYAMKDGKTPMISSVCGIAGVVALSLLFVNVFKMQVGGLALASSVSAYIVSLVLAVKMMHVNKGIITKKFYMTVLKISVSAIVMGLAVVAVKSFIPLANVWLTLVLCGGMGMIIYFALLYVFKVQEVLK